MTTQQPLRLVQWTSGKVATEAVKAILARPDMELVGAFAFSAKKVGQDLGVLCGIEAPIGVVATDDIDAIIALKPDCVLYMPLHPDVDHVEQLLRGGINVATTAHFMTGPTARKPRRAWRPRLWPVGSASSAAASTPATPSCWRPPRRASPRTHAISAPRVVQHRDLGRRRQPGRARLGPPSGRRRPR